MIFDSFPGEGLEVDMLLLQVFLRFAVRRHADLNL
jgi:hypothetical protein